MARLMGGLNISSDIGKASQDEGACVKCRRLRFIWKKRVKRVAFYGSWWAVACADVTKLCVLTLYAGGTLSRGMKTDARLR